MSSREKHILSTPVNLFLCLYLRALMRASSFILSLDESPVIYVII